MSPLCPALAPEGVVDNCDYTMQQLEVDVSIIGAGPAGISTALSLLKHNPDSRILVIERSDLETERIGEQVSDSIFDLLDYLDIAHDQSDNNCFLPVYDSVAYWGSDRPVLRENIATAGGGSFQLGRKAFEQSLLLQFSQRGGMLLPRSRCTTMSFNKTDNRWHLNVMSSRKGNISIDCRFLVDATGRRGSLAKKLTVSIIKHDRLIGIGAFFDISHCERITTHQLIETTEQGWWYSATLPNKRRCVILFTDADIASKHQLHRPENWQKMLSQSRHVRHYLTGSLPLSRRPWIKPAHTLRVGSINASNYIPVGDAALAFDPISSCGIGFALSSGCQAGVLIDIALQRLQLDEYLSDLQRFYTQHLQYQQQYYAREIRWKNAAFWQRRQLQK